MSEQKTLIKRRVKRRRVCHFCADKINLLDYKDVEKFQRYISDRGKIAPRRNTGFCAKHQRILAEAVRRARYMAIIPHTTD
jgi:small subunit ribosomal protein S18